MVCLYRTIAILVLPSVRAMTTQPTRSSSQKGGWSAVALKAAKDFTVSQRNKLEELGALDIQRPLRISGEPISTHGTSTDRTHTHTRTRTQNDMINEHDSTTKIIHFQRHSQGFHNLICDIWREKGLPIDFDSDDFDLNPVIRPEFLDPPLTETGRQQGIARREECASLSPELLIVSPLLRCIQTAKLSFRDHDTDKIKWISHEGCREELGLITGNKRRAMSDIMQDYPDIDFTPVQHNEDVLWDQYGKRRETLLEKSERIYDFLAEFVMHRPEKEIVIVSHSAYLFTLMNAVMDIDDEELRSWFLTSEVRSMKVVFQPNHDHEIE